MKTSTPKPAKAKIKTAKAAPAKVTVKPPKPAKVVYSLEKGQLWRVKDVHLQVMEVGKTLIHYRHFKQHPRVPTSMASITSVQTYLKENRAKLIDPSELAIKQRPK